MGRDDKVLGSGVFRRAATLVLQILKYAPRQTEGTEERAAWDEGHPWLTDVQIGLRAGLAGISPLFNARRFQAEYVRSFKGEMCFVALRLLPLFSLV